MAMELLPEVGAVVKRHLNVLSLMSLAERARVS